jgi:hypothetical protein
LNAWCCLITLIRQQAHSNWTVHRYYHSVLNGWNIFSSLSDSCVSWTGQCLLVMPFHQHGEKSWCDGRDIGFSISQLPWVSVNYILGLLRLLAYVSYGWSNKI